MKVPYVAAVKALHGAGRLRPIRLAATQRLTGDFPTALQGSRWPPPPRTHGPGQGPRPAEGPRPRQGPTARRGPRPARSPGFPPPHHTGPGTACCRGHPLFPGQPKTRFSPNRCAGREKAGKPPQISPSATTCRLFPAGRRNEPGPAGLQLPACLAVPHRLHLVRRRGGRAPAPFPFHKGSWLRCFNKSCVTAELSAVGFWGAAVRQAVGVLPRETLSPHDLGGHASGGGSLTAGWGSPLPGRSVSLRSCKTAFLSWKRL